MALQVEGLERERGTGNLYTPRALKILSAGGSGACLDPPNCSGHQAAAPSLGPGGLAAPRPAAQPGHWACLRCAGRETAAADSQCPRGSGHGCRAREQGVLGHHKTPSTAGVDRRLQTLGGGGGNSGRPEIPNPGGGGARAHRAQAEPGREVNPIPQKGRGCPGPYWVGGRGRASDRDAEAGSPPILTSEHRLGPRNYGHHHGLLLVLPFLAFECHLEAVECGAFGLQGHGAAGDIAAAGRWRTRAQAWALGPLPPAPPPSRRPSPTPRHPPDLRRHVRASARPGASRPQTRRVQSGAPAPCRSLLWSLIVGARRAGPPRARPRTRRSQSGAAPPRARGSVRISELAGRRERPADSRQHSDAGAGREVLRLTPEGSS